MGAMNRAARLGFLVLLIGAGAAAVSARPSNAVAGSAVEVVKGDPRLDLAWALAEGGMTDGDSPGVGGVLVEGVAPAAENQVLTVTFTAEFWWKADRPGRPGALQMMRGRVNMDWSRAFRHAMRDRACSGDEVPFVPLRAIGDPALPFPAGEVVLMRLIKVHHAGALASVHERAFAPVMPSEVRVECLPVALDLETGVQVPTSWPGG